MKITWLLFHLAVVMLILLAAFSPFFFVMQAAGVANANGCQLDEGSVHPCVVNGVDRGEELYQKGMMGWLGIVTVPLGFGAALVYAAGVVVVVLVRRARRNGRTAGKNSPG